MLISIFGIALLTNFMLLYFLFCVDLLIESIAFLLKRVSFCVKTQREKEKYLDDDHGIHLLMVTHE